MSNHINYRRVGVIAGLAVVAALVVAWAGGLLPKHGGSLPANALIVIAPYRHAGTWVFDDPGARLVREPFVAGVPEMIDVVVRDSRTFSPSPTATPSTRGTNSISASSTSGCG